MTSAPESTSQTGDLSGGPRPAPRAGESFWKLLPQAFVYPLRGSGKWMILTGGVGLCVGEIAARFAFFAGAIVQVTLLAYFAMYALRNIGATANGDREPPGWPDIRSPDDTVLPLLLVLGSVFLCMCPFIGYRAFCWIQWIHGPEPSPLLSWALAIAGLSYLPMGLLSVSLRDSLAGLNPLVVLPAIIRVLPAYLTALLAIVLACALVYSLGLLAWIPLVSSLAGAMFGVYWITAVTYILGSIYRGYKERLGWNFE